MRGVRENVMSFFGMTQTNTNRNVLSAECWGVFAYFNFIWWFLVEAAFSFQCRSSFVLHTYIEKRGIVITATRIRFGWSASCLHVFHFASHKCENAINLWLFEWFFYSSSWCIVQIVLSFQLLSGFGCHSLNL